VSDLPDDISARLREALIAPEQVAAPNYLIRLELADATRRLISESLTTVADSDAIGEATRLVAAASALLAGLPHGREYESAEASVTGDPHTSVFVSPFVGSLNPLAPPLYVDMVDDRILATGVFGDQYEGPPGYVHGGVIAAVFDEVLGFAQSLSGRPGMTGRLTIHYRKPTPLHGVAHRRPRRSGGRPQDLHDRSSLPRRHAVRRAEGLFISMDPQRFLDMRPAGVSWTWQRLFGAVSLRSDNRDMLPTPPHCDGTHQLLAMTSARTASRRGPRRFAASRPTPGRAANSSTVSGRAAAMTARVSSVHTVRSGRRAARAADWRQRCRAASTGSGSVTTVRRSEGGGALVISTVVAATEASHGDGTRSFPARRAAHVMCRRSVARDRAT
jgi:acyl-coenzyme A thioesterase PaaI-like protein